MVEDTGWGEGVEVGQCGMKVIYPSAGSPLRTRSSSDHDTIRTGGPINFQKYGMTARKRAAWER